MSGMGTTPHRPGPGDIDKVGAKQDGIGIVEPQGAGIAQGRLQGKHGHRVEKPQHTWPHDVSEWSGPGDRNGNESATQPIGSRGFL